MSIQAFQTLHQLKAERLPLDDLLKKQLEAVQDTKAMIALLDAKVEIIREELQREAQKRQDNKVSYIGLGSYSIRQWEKQTIADKTTAASLAQTIPDLQCALETKLNEKIFLEQATKLLSSDEVAAEAKEAIRQLVQTHTEWSGTLRLS